jgi:Arc/MetJ-type ribon-helix-helix transcriptional regulator
MAQVVARIDDRLAAAVDELVESGIVASRSEAVRIGLEEVVERLQRQRVGARIVAGYEEMPQTDTEVGWADDATVRMIGDESW